MGKALSSAGNSQAVLCGVILFGKVVGVSDLRDQAGSRPQLSQVAGSVTGGSMTTLSLSVFAFNRDTRILLSPGSD